MCRSDCVRHTRLEKNFIRFLSPKKCIRTMLGGIHHSNSWEAASLLTFNRSTIAAIALVYCRSKTVCSSDCVRRRTWNKFLSAPHYLGSALSECKRRTHFGPIFFKLPTSQPAQRYHAWRRSSFEQTSWSLPIMHPLLHVQV